MKLLRRLISAFALIVSVGLVVPAAAFAQTDEIQVYDAVIAEPGIFNLTWHNNFIADGLKTPAFPGGLIPDKSFNGVTEWAYGVTDWFELGLYLPLYSISKDRGATFDFGYNALHWQPRRFTSEIRPIIGWHLHPVDIIVNPILDNSFSGGFKSLDFAPAERVAYNFPPKWALAVEEYADYGLLRNLASGSQQVHELYAIFDRYSKVVNVEAGVGFGLTSSSDKITLKLILSRDLNQRAKN